MKDTEMNNVQFLFLVMQDADIETEDDFDGQDSDDAEDEKVDEVMEKLFEGDSGIFDAAMDALNYKGDLDGMDVEVQDIDDYSIGRHTWTASKISAEWLRDNCSNSRLGEIHQAIEDVAYVDGILKGKEAELLNEMARIWELDTKRYKVDVESVKPVTGETSVVMPSGVTRSNSAEKDDGTCPDCGTEMESYMLMGGAMVSFGGPNSGVVQTVPNEEGYECPKCGYDTIGYG